MTKYARIADLLGGLERSGPESFDAAVQRLAAAVPAAGQRGQFLINLGAADEIDSRRHRTMSLEGTGDGAGASQPDAEIRCSEETLWSMLDGSYSPVEAFRDGKLRVRGDELLLKRVLRHLAGPDGSVDCM